MCKNNFRTIFVFYSYIGLLIFGIAFIGCDGGDSSDDSSSLINFAGTYEGTYKDIKVNSGPLMSGPWKMVIESDGNISYLSVDYETANVSGTVNSNGEFSFEIIDYGEGSGKIEINDNENKMDGTFSNFAGEVSSLSGKRVNTSITEPENNTLSITSFKINNGAGSTTSKTVTLNNSANGNPTYYMASESSTFSGATWKTYSSSPSFTLSSGNGTKTVYFKITNNAEESLSVSDTITLSETTTPKSFAEIAGTWKITTPTGNTNSFNVANDGKITNFHMAVKVNTSCVGSGFGYSSIDCGDSTKTVNMTLNTVETTIAFAFSGTKKSGASTLAVNGKFNSPSSASGTYTASYSHDSYSSQSVMSESGSKSGSWTATKQ
ncbi:MAG: hypothetical protein HQK76_20665 [Desulfobacterales bacterium]|nr:hypothetical protein [Desulfobacterales bacterium]